jgi:hypothetical protein
MWREWTIVQWFYRTFVCPKVGHEYKHWSAFGLPAQPYCIRCEAVQEDWTPPVGVQHVWRAQ